MREMNDNFEKDRSADNDNIPSHPSYSHMHQKHSEVIQNKTKKINNISIFKYPQDEDKKVHLKYRDEEPLPELYKVHNDMDPELFRQLGNTSPIGGDPFNLKKFWDNGSKMKNKANKKYDNVILKNPNQNYSFDINRTKEQSQGKFSEIWNI